MLEDEGDWTTHRIDDGIAIVLPASWFVSRDHFGVTLIAVEARDDPGAFSPNLNVAIRPAPSGRLEEAAAEELTAAGDVLTDLAVEIVESAEVAGRAGVRTAATYRSGRAVVRLEQWTAPVGDSIVTVSCSAARDEWEGYRERFHRCVQGLELA